jgi:hypothetical protein
MTIFELKTVTNAGFRQNYSGDWDVYVESPEGLRLYATCGYEQYAKDTAEALRAYATALRMMPDFIEFTKKVRKEMDE